MYTWFKYVPCCRSQSKECESSGCEETADPGPTVCHTPAAGFHTHTLTMVVRWWGEPRGPPGHSFRKQLGFKSSASRLTALQPKAPFKQPHPCEKGAAWSLCSNDPQRRSWPSFPAATKWGEAGHCFVHHVTPEKQRPIHSHSTRAWCAWGRWKPASASARDPVISSQVHTDSIELVSSNFFVSLKNKRSQGAYFAVWELISVQETRPKGLSLTSLIVLFCFVNNRRWSVVCCLTAFTSFYCFCLFTRGIRESL